MKQSFNHVNSTWGMPYTFPQYKGNIVLYLNMISSFKCSLIICNI